MNRSMFQLSKSLQRVTLRRGNIFGAVILGALAAFEIFNYSTTEFALNDLLGTDLRFMGISWATILSLAFCGIDFAGIARLFTPDHKNTEPNEVWYLFGAWLLAALMNATLTWWGVAVAVRSHPALSDLVLSRQTLVTSVPIFVAVMVWVIRILLIGTFSLAGERLFSFAGERVAPSKQVGSRPYQAYPTPLARLVSTGVGYNNHIRPAQPAPKPEPTYHPVGLTARSNDSGVRIRE